MCQEKALSLQILSARWILFSPILRRDKDIPAKKKQQELIFISNGNKLRGRPKTTNSVQQRSRTDSTPNQTTLK